MSTHRTLKILGKFRRRAWDHTTVPKIRLEGKWLEKLGFEVGGTVSIKTHKNKLIITTNKKEPQSKT